jgi:hypothetical protein
VPRSLYRDLPLQDETRKIFDDAKTGRLSAEPHGWSKEHRVYNNAVGERIDELFRQTKPEELTPAQARSFVDSIRSSSDPRIRGFNLKIYMNEIYYWIRRRPPVGIDD